MGQPQFAEGDQVVVVQDGNRVRSGRVLEVQPYCHCEHVLGIPERHDHNYIIEDAAGLRSHWTPDAVRAACVSCLTEPAQYVLSLKQLPEIEVQIVWPDRPVCWGCALDAGFDVPVQEEPRR